MLAYYSELLPNCLTSKIIILFKVRYVFTNNFLQIVNITTSRVTISLKMYFHILRLINGWYDRITNLIL